MAEHRCRAHPIRPPRKLCSEAGCSAQSAGFTLVEMLVVLLLLGLAALVVAENLNDALRRWQLDASATSLSQFLESAPGWAKNQQMPVFLLWRPDRDIVEIAVDAGGTSVLAHHDLPPFLVVSPEAAMTLRCDTFGRAFSATSSVMLEDPQTVVVNHHMMVEGMVAPQIEYRLTISPLWHVAQNRRKL